MRKNLIKKLYISISSVAMLSISVGNIVEGMYFSDSSINSPTNQSLGIERCLRLSVQKNANIYESVIACIPSEVTNYYSLGTLQATLQRQIDSAISIQENCGTIFNWGDFVIYASKLSFTLGVNEVIDRIKLLLESDYNCTSGEVNLSCLTLPIIMRHISNALFGYDNKAIILLIPVNLTAYGIEKRNAALQNCSFNSVSQHSYEEIYTRRETSEASFSSFGSGNGMFYSELNSSETIIYRRFEYVGPFASFGAGMPQQAQPRYNSGYMNYATVPFEQNISGTNLQTSQAIPQLQIEPAALAYQPGQHMSESTQMSREMPQFQSDPTHIGFLECANDSNPDISQYLTNLIENAPDLRYRFGEGYTLQEKLNALELNEHIKRTQDISNKLSCWLANRVVNYFVFFKEFYNPNDMYTLSVKESLLKTLENSVMKDKINWKLLCDLGAEKHIYKATIEQKRDERNICFFVILPTTETY